MFLTLLRMSGDDFLFFSFLLYSYSSVSADSLLRTVVHCLPCHPSPSKSSSILGDCHHSLNIQLSTKPIELAGVSFRVSKRLTIFHRPRSLFPRAADSLDHFHVTRPRVRLGNSGTSAEKERAIISNVFVPNRTDRTAVPPGRSTEF